MESINRLILYKAPLPSVKGTIPPDVANKMQQLLNAGDRDGVSTFMLEVAMNHPTNSTNSAHCLPRLVL